VKFARISICLRANCHRLLLSVPSQMSHSANTESSDSDLKLFPRGLDSALDAAVSTQDISDAEESGEDVSTVPIALPSLPIPSHFILDFKKQVSSTQANKFISTIIICHHMPLV
jgi:hypothetical protein